MWKEFNAKNPNKTEQVETPKNPENLFAKRRRKKWHHFVLNYQRNHRKKRNKRRAMMIILRISQHQLFYVFTALGIYESDEQKTDDRKSLKEPDESEFLSKDYIR